MPTWHAARCLLPTIPRSRCASSDLQGNAGPVRTPAEMHSITTRRHGQCKTASPQHITTKRCCCYEDRRPNRGGRYMGIVSLRRSAHALDRGAHATRSSARRGKPCGLSAKAGLSEHGVRVAGQDCLSETERLGQGIPACRQKRARMAAKRERRRRLRCGYCTASSVTAVPDAVTMSMLPWPSTS